MPPVHREKVKPGVWRRKSARGRWVYEVTFRDSDGKQRRRTVAGGQRDAETELAAIKADMGRGKRVAPNPRLTVKEAAAKWLEVKSPNLAPKTVRAYRYGLDQHVLPELGNRRLDALTVDEVARFVARMATPEYRRKVEARGGREPTAEAGYSAQTIKSTLIPLSRSLAYAKRNLGFAGENVVTALDLDERPGYRQRKKKKRKLGRDEMDALIAASHSPWREIIATAAALGTRMGETLGIEWRHVDFERGVVVIEQQADATGVLTQLKTETSRRRVEAPDWLLSMYRAHRLRSPHASDSDLIFATSTGRPHRHGNVLRRLYDALEAAGLPQTSFHSLRHTHASLWIKDGGDVITLSRRLGHANPQITMTTYADEIEEAADNAARRARANALFGSTAMAATLAAGEVSTPQPSRGTPAAEVVELPRADDAAQ